MEECAGCGDKCCSECIENCAGSPGGCDGTLKFCYECASERGEVTNAANIFVMPVGATPTATNVRNVGVNIVETAVRAQTVPPVKIVQAADGYSAQALPK